MLVEKDVFVGIAHTTNTTTNTRTVRLTVEDSVTNELIVDLELNPVQFMRVMASSVTMVAAKVYVPED